MPIATIRPIGDGLYHIHILEGGGTDPGYGQGRPGGDHISNRPPGSWEGRPDNSLPGYGHPGNRPPGSWEGRPDNSLPGSPGHPDNRPPSGPPPQVGPGEVLVLIRDQAGVWHYAAIQPGSPPPRPLPPGPPDHIANRPPGSGLPPHVGGGPMPGQPPIATQPPPTGATPKPA